MPTPVQPWLLSALDLLALLCGTVGAILLALAIGEPPGGSPGQFVMTDKKGRERIFPIAAVRSLRLWWWGIRLIAAAFLLQSPKVVLALLRSL